MKKEVLITLALFLFPLISSADCNPNWTCSNWSDCTSNTQIRTCYDSNICGVLTGKPPENQSCGTNCIPNWICGEWGPSNCDETLLKTRTCTDSNACGIIDRKPEEAMSCDFSKDYSWMFFFIVAAVIILIIGIIWLIKRRREDTIQSLYKPSSLYL